MAHRWLLDPTSQRVALTVLRRGPISRSDLGRDLGLSSASVTRLTKPMVQAGLLVERDPLERSTGRPAFPLDIAADSASFIGLKVSHQCVHAVLTDLRGTIHATGSRPGGGLSPAGLTTVVCALVDELTAGRNRPNALGVCLGATVGVDGLVRGAHFLGWDDPVDLGALLEADSGLPTTIDNDVNAFTVAEHWFGAGRSATEFAVVTIGAGVGVGLVARDDLIRGRAGAAGMVGPLYLSGGRRVGDVLHGEVLAERVSGLLGRRTTIAELAGLPASVDPEGALAGFLDEVADAVGELAGTVAAITAPEVVLVAGEGAPLLQGREARVVAGVARMVPDHVAVPEVVVAEVGEDEWARGAAALAIRRHMGVRAHS